MTVYNTSDVSTEMTDCQGLKRIGSFRNMRRWRLVTLYEHPTRPEMVVSVGNTFDPGGQYKDEGATFICTEPRSAYPRQLEQGDWSPYN